MSIYTLGHSKWTQAQFLAILTEVQKLSGRPLGIVDVRSHPTSKWEWFHLESMSNWLRGAGFQYVWLPYLGGWDERHADLAEQFAPRGVDVAAYTNGKFPKQRIALGKTEYPLLKAWTNQGLYDYSWFMSLGEFFTGIRILQRLDTFEFDPVLVCAEVLWWKCHRSMIADHLGFHGESVVHLTPRERRDGTFALTKQVHDWVGRIDRYEPEIIQAWEHHATIVEFRRKEWMRRSLMTEDRSGRLPR